MLKLLFYCQILGMIYNVRPLSGTANYHSDAMPNHISQQFLQRRRLCKVIPPFNSRYAQFRLKQHILMQQVTESWFAITAQAFVKE